MSLRSLGHGERSKTRRADERSGSTRQYFRAKFGLIRSATGPALPQRRARVVLDDPDYRPSAFERLRPNVPKWLPAWLDTHLVVIDLDE